MTGSSWLIPAFPPLAPTSFLASPAYEGHGGADGSSTALFRASRRVESFSPGRDGLPWGLLRLVPSPDAAGQNPGFLAALPGLIRPLQAKTCPDTARNRSFELQITKMTLQIGF